MPAIRTERAIARLVMYRRLLEQLRSGSEYVFSHTLADLAGLTASQVLRDVMELEYLGNPWGYRVTDLLDRIGSVLDPPGRRLRCWRVPVNLAVRVILRQLGAAAEDRGRLRYRHSESNRKVHGHVCQNLHELPETVERDGVTVGVVAVPAAAAVGVAAMMVAAGITGILNFAPVTLVIPEGVYVEQVDLSVSIERVAYMVRHASELPARRGHEHRSV